MVTKWKEVQDKWSENLRLNLPQRHLQFADLNESQGDYAVHDALYYNKEFCDGSGTALGCTYWGENPKVLDKIGRAHV